MLRSAGRMSNGVAPPWLHGAEAQQVVKCVLGVATPPLPSGEAPGELLAPHAPAHV